MKNTTGQQPKDAKDLEIKLDQEFIKTMLEIEKHYSLFNKHEKIRIEQWSKKLCEVTQNPTWKQNRNNYVLLLLKGVQKGTLTEPFNKIPPEGSLPSINKHIVKKRVASVDQRQNKLKAEQSQNESQLNQDSEFSRISNVIHTPKQVQTPLKIIENIIEAKIQENDSNRNYDTKNVGSSDNLESNVKIRQSIKENVDKMSEQGINVSRITENKEIMRLRGELELAKVNLESMKNELEIKNLNILQLTKKNTAAQNTIKKLQEEKNTLTDLLKVIKKGLEEQSINFTNKSMGFQFIKQFNEHCFEFYVPPIDHKNVSIGDWNSLSKMLTTNSPGRSEVSTLHIETVSPIPNYESTGRKGNSINGNINHFKDTPYQQQKEYSSVEDMSRYTSKQNKPSIAYTPKSTTSRYEEAKSLLQTADKDTADFLEYLESFQRESERLKRETQDLLMRSASKL